MDKQLKNKAVKIQGRDYVLVSDRVLFFNEQYPNGSIKTKLLSDPASDRIVIRAIVRPDCEQNREFFGHAQEIVGEGFINRTSAMENAETSAVGRALAMMGVGVIESIASVDEINKAKNIEQKIVAIEKAKDAGKDPFTTHEPLPREGICAECGGITSFKEGTTIKGKPYKGLFCTDRKHKPTWL